MKSEQFILSIDQGTSSSRAILFDHLGRVKGVDQKEVKQLYPHPAWVEQDANEIWSSTKNVIEGALAKAAVLPSQIAAIGITNQRETTVLWDKKSGVPVYNAIVWQSRQSEEICHKLQEAGAQGMIKQKTGLVIDPYFSASKLTWIFEQKPELLARAKQGELLFGTVDSWLIWNLSGGKSHVTDFSNASRTLLFNIRELKWDAELLKTFSIPKEILPEVVMSSGTVAKTSVSVMQHEIPIAGIAGDQQAALFGQRCTKVGMVKNTYGTGCFTLMNTGADLIESKSGLLTTIAWGINGKVEYALEGGVFVAGAAIKWLRDGLKIIKSSSETEALANQVSSTDGVYVVPAFAGLGAPHWKSNARGAIFGLTLGSNNSHLIRAVLESLAYQSKDLLTVMEKDSGIKIPMLRVDGGACANNLLMQFQADILGISVERPQALETTAVGAAYLAGLGVSFWTADDIDHIGGVERQFTPKMSEELRTELYKGWVKAVNATISYSE